MNLDSPEALEERLRQIGAERYHDKHPFHKLMQSGKLSRYQFQAWALNRYYYQSRLPIKDAALISRLADSDFRRKWLHRLLDHDGTKADEGGICRWVYLCECLGLSREYVVSAAGILPATRFAVDAYVTYVRERPVLQAVASSLTELFSPAIIAERVTAMLERYDFVERDALAYFTARLEQAPRDSSFVLDYVKAKATTPQLRREVCEALVFKMDVLWTQLDALHFSYVEPGFVPPGAFSRA